MAGKYSQPLEAQLYDIEPIAQYIEQGIAIITPNQRLASRVKAAWSQYQIQKGAKVWDTPNIISRDQWRTQQWQVISRQALFAGDTDKLALFQKKRLTSHQEAALWEQCIRESDHGEGLLRPSATARQAAQT